MSDDGGGNGYGYGGYGRFVVPPSVQTPVVEADENRILVEQSFLIFVACMVLLAVLYLFLNSAAAQMSWLWQVLVRVALVVPAALVGLVAYRWLDGASTGTGHYWCALLGFGVWFFLAGGKLNGVLGDFPFGEVADYLVVSFDFPEGAEFGAVLVALWRATVAGVLVSVIIALLPLIARLRRELADIHHGALELERERLRLEWEREKFYAQHPEVEVIEGQVMSRPIPINLPNHRSVTVPVLPPAYSGLTGYSARAGKEIDVPADVVRYVLDLVWKGDRTLARKHWASDERVTLAQWEVVVAKLEDTKLCNGKKLMLNPDEIMRRFGLQADSPTPLPGNGGGTSAENTRNGMSRSSPSRPVVGAGGSDDDGEQEG